MSNPLKGFHCLAVYDRPRSDAEAEAEAAASLAAATASSSSSSSSKKQKKRKQGAEEAVAASAPSSASSSSSGPLVRYLYYKSHSTRVDDDSVKAGCTLFVVNLPWHYREEHLTQLFACFGAVESVSFLQSGNLTPESDPSRVGAVAQSSFYRSAHVVYEESDSVDLALRTDLSNTPQPCPEEMDDINNVGMRSQKRPNTWLSSYHSSHPAVAALQVQVDRFMEGFDARAAEERLASRRGGGAAQETDGEGWTLVRGSSRGKKRAILAVEEETARAEERAKKKQKKNQILHFYKHAEREAKKERLLALREKFEQDKLKIAKMKQDRKFKPY